jgi:hypothetical protein
MVESVIVACFGFDGSDPASQHLMHILLVQSLLSTLPSTIMYKFLSKNIGIVRVSDKVLIRGFKGV